LIGEIIPAIYDVQGKSIGFPVSRKHKHLFHGTFPIGRYVSQPLSFQCSSIKELCHFLNKCAYMSDQEQFHREDYWMPPEEFEKCKRGDCDDFALWTWRQLIGMGYKARYVIGRSGKYGEGHAWVTMEKMGKFYIVEPLASMTGEALPRLSVVRYEPNGSVEWDGRNIYYYIHEKREFSLPLLKIPILIGEWLLFWTCLCLRFSGMLCLLPFFLIKNFIKKRL
jgi:hypothetical protein